MKSCHPSIRLLISRHSFDPLEPLEKTLIAAAARRSNQQRSLPNRCSASHSDIDCIFPTCWRIWIGDATAIVRRWNKKMEVGEIKTDRHRSHVNMCAYDTCAESSKRQAPLLCKIMSFAGRNRGQSEEMNYGGEILRPLLRTLTGNCHQMLGEKQSRPPVWAEDIFGKIALVNVAMHLMMVMQISFSSFRERTLGMSI